MSVRVSDVERAIARRFPSERAEAWDRMGLLAGDPDRQVTGVVLALDPTPSAICATAALGANVLVTHHPVFLEPPSRVTPGRGPAGALFAALDAQVALINAHTSLDRDAEAQRLLPAALGLAPLRPLERSPMPMSVVTVYAPAEAAEKVRAAMAGAGAGRIGDYERCAFEAPGTGTFTPPADASPLVGAPGIASEADEVRIEMVCPRKAARGVISAAASAHPYEEPLVTATEVVLSRGAARLGMVSDAPEGETLATLASRAGQTYGVTARVWGDPEIHVDTVATSTGSAGSLIGDALAARAQALVAGEVRYHDALDAVEAGLGIVELGHDVTEWPLVRLLEDVVRGIPGIDSAAVHVLEARAGWWSTQLDEGDR